MTLRPLIAQATALTVFLSGWLSLVPGPLRAASPPEPAATEWVAERNLPTATKTLVSELEAAFGRPIELEGVREEERWRPTPAEQRAVIEYAASLGFEVTPDAVSKASSFLRSDADL